MAKEFPTLLFADGASSGNPGPGGWGALVVTRDGRVRESGGGDRATTNNRMELAAVIAGLDALSRLEPKGGTVEVWTDSTYVIRGITQWIWAWRKRGWKTAEGADVSNRELWERLSAQVMRLKSTHKIEWKHVRGHAGVPGNERVDAIAVAYSRGERPKLYDGPLLGYGVAVHDLPESGELPEPKPRAEKKATAYSYLSELGGKPERHATWAECERRVKGRSGARFKKAMTADEETEILAAWGFSPEDLS